MPPELIIDSLSRCNFHDDQLIDCHITVPVVGETMGLASFSIEGWLLGRDGAVNAVEVTDAEDILATGPVHHARPDVAAAFPDIAYADTPGFAVPISVVGLPSPFEIDVACVLGNDERLPLLKVSGRYRLETGDFEPSRQPLMVTTWGRMGTTWFLRLLREHSGILVHGHYPYETRAAVYWSQMLKVLTEPGAVGEVFPEDISVIGPHPLNLVPPAEELYVSEWFASEYTSELIRHCRWSIERFYEEVARQNARLGARYFAEKVPPLHFPRTIWSLYPDAKEIVLVRDFRDVFCSIRSFNARRGFAAFGREHATSDEDFVEYLREAALRLKSAWCDRAPRSLLLRYEDLIREPIGSLCRVLQYLEIEGGEAIAKQMLEAALADSHSMREHLTAESPEASVGRWRRDLDSNLTELCNEALGDILDEFGYETSVAERFSST